MSRIIRIESAMVYIGENDGSIFKTPISTISYANPQIGDEVQIFKDEDLTIVTLNKPQKTNSSQLFYELGNEKRIEKNLYVWVATFLFGSFGVDRFLRGQIALGIIKLLTCGGLGIWSLIDFIIALTKVYGNSFGDTNEVIFINGEYAR